MTSTNLQNRYKCKLIALVYCAYLHILMKQELIRLLSRKNFSFLKPLQPVYQIKYCNNCCFKKMHNSAIVWLWLLDPQVDCLHIHLCDDIKGVSPFLWQKHFLCPNWFQLRGIPCSFCFCDEITDNWSMVTYCCC